MQTFIVVVPMTFIIGMFSVITNGYFRQEDWFANFLENWLTVLPVAYLAALLIIPLARRLTNLVYNS